LWRWRTPSAFALLGSRRRRSSGRRSRALSAAEPFSSDRLGCIGPMSDPYTGTSRRRMALRRRAERRPVTSGLSAPAGTRSAFTDQCPSAPLQVPGVVPVHGTATVSIWSSTHLPLWRLPFPTARSHRRRCASAPDVELLTLIHAGTYPLAELNGSGSSCRSQLTGRNPSSWRAPWRRRTRRTVHSDHRSERLGPRDLVGEADAVDDRRVTEDPFVRIADENPYAPWRREEAPVAVLPSTCGGAPRGSRRYSSNRQRTHVEHRA